MLAKGHFAEDCWYQTNKGGGNGKKGNTCQGKGTTPKDGDTKKCACQQKHGDLGGRRGSAKGRRRDVTRSRLGSSGLSLFTYCCIRDMVWRC